MIRKALEQPLYLIVLTFFLSLVEAQYILSQAERLFISL